MMVQLGTSFWGRRPRTPPPTRCLPTSKPVENDVLSFALARAPARCAGLQRRHREPLHFPRREKREDDEDEDESIAP